MNFTVIKFATKGNCFPCNFQVVPYIEFKSLQCLFSIKVAITVDDILLENVVGPVMTF